MRSKLFVPASRPELFAKAMAGAADALSFDLEDAVPAGRKVEARAALRAFLASPTAAEGSKTLIVRINPVESEHFAEDVRAVVQPGLHIVNLPKPRHPGDVRAAADAVARAREENGVTAPVGLLVNIETPAALRTGHELAAADASVVGLQLGFGDLFEPLGIDRRDAGAVRQAMFAVRMAAGEAGVFAYDAAFPDIADEAGFREEAGQARRLAFIGKSCIHPSQVALANAAFRPTDEEIAHSLRVVAAARQAATDGVGAWVVDGKMIDAPFVQRAEAIVALARRLGLVEGTR